LGEGNWKDDVPVTYWEAAARTKMGIYLTSVEMAFFLKSIDFSKCHLVGDIGAEAGKFSLLAAEKNVQVVAIDIDLLGLKRLKFKNKLANVVLADARNIPLREDILDAAFMMEVIDYIPELDTVLSECGRILKNGCSLVFSFGNKTSLKSKLRSLRGKSYRHSYGEITNELRKAGFKLARKEGFNWLLFGRTSENSLVPLSAKMERLFGLRKTPSVSPWVIVQAVTKKRSRSPSS
jgi:SAM-dependent methyltransferase